MHRLSGSALGVVHRSEDDPLIILRPQDIQGSIPLLDLLLAVTGRGDQLPGAPRNENWTSLAKMLIT